MKKGFALREGFHGGDKELAGIGLEQVAARSRLEQLADQGLAPRAMVKISTSVCGCTAQISRVASTPLRRGSRSLGMATSGTVSAGELHRLPTVLGLGHHRPSRLGA